MRLLAQLRRNTWECGPLTRVRGAIPSGILPEETADDLMITCCTDGTACVWENKDSSFQILCFLSHLDIDGQVVKVNDACAIILDTSVMSPTSDLRFRILTGGEDGCTRLWSFEKEMVGKKLWRAFADSEAEPYGIPQRIEADAHVYHECDKCMHHHAVLSLALLPERWSGQSNDITFNFISGTTAGFASIYAVSEANGQFSIKPLEPSVQLMHQKETVVNHVTVTTDFLPDKGTGQTVLVGTCGGRGAAKVWRLSKFTDKSCQVELLKSCAHTDEQGEFLLLNFVGFTPAWEDGVQQFFITSSFDERRQERSRIFAWDLSTSTRDLKLPAARTYVFRASNFSFWYPRTVDANVGQYIYCLTSAPDNSAKMFRLINMETGRLTQPLLNTNNEEDPDESKDDSKDNALIEHCFTHSGPVTSVITVRKKSSAIQTSIAASGKRKANTKTEASYSSIEALTTSYSMGYDDQTITDQWYFVTGSTDRVANVWDPSTKQCVHSLRAAMMSEMYLPLLMQILTMSQLASFSFKREFKWNQKTISPTREICGIVTIDSSAVAEFMPMSQGEVALICVALSMIVVLIFEYALLKDVIAVQSRYLHNIEISQAFRQEVKEGQTGLRGMPMGPEHLARDAMEKKRAFIFKMINLGSTAIVVPVFKTMIRFTDCIEVDDGTRRVKIAKDVEWLSCDSDVYLYLRPATIIVLVAYVFLILPFTVVKGDARVVARKDLFRPKQWFRNAVQKSELVNLGAMRVNSHAFFWEKILELMAKIMVPTIDILVHPPFHLPWQDEPLSEDNVLLLRASLITSIYAIVVFQAWGWQLYVEASINGLFTGLKFVTFWAGLCSILISWIASPELLWPSLIFYAGLAINIAVTLILYNVRSNRELKEDMEAETHIMKEGAVFTAG
mmetsp:Transcript_94735/g.203483  ORF Transcript_94735/g.203483 Transcript_94735/m.203483 type:complete len:902 (-) Transcript_94735:199-2904(-)